MKLSISVLGGLALAVGASARCAGRTITTTTTTTLSTMSPRPSTSISTSTSTNTNTATSTDTSTNPSTDTSTNPSNILSKGKGFGTYYYDVEQRQACGADFGTQNKGNVMCNWAAYKSLDDINSNNLVAISANELKTAAGRAKYCGKRVVVTVNGVKSDIPFFVGDGCERCARGNDASWTSEGAAGLDFSFSTLDKLSPLACQDGHVAVEWEIVDETLYHFDL